MSNLREGIVHYGSGKDIAGENTGCARLFNFPGKDGVRVVVTRSEENLPGREWVGVSGYEYVDFTPEQAKALLLALAEVIRECEK